MKQLSDTDSKTNLKLAFRASDSESILRVVDVNDIINKKNPDQLSIMTYLFNICDKFEPKTSKKFSKKNVKSKTLLPNMENKEVPTKKKQPAPILSSDKAQQNQNKQKSSYFNPFDEDDDESNLKNNHLPNTVPTSGLIQIKPNGEIVDVNQNEINPHLYDQKPSNNTRIVQRRNSLNNSSSSSSSSSSLNSSTTVNKVKFYF